MNVGLQLLTDRVWQILEYRPSSVTHTSGNNFVSMTWDSAGLSLGLLIDDGDSHISLIDSVAKTITVANENDLEALIGELTAKMIARLPHKG